MKIFGVDYFPLTGHTTNMHYTDQAHSLTVTSDCATFSLSLALIFCALAEVCMYILFVVSWKMDFQ